MCGLLLINKPAGITSFGAVAKIRKLTGEKHIGHTGTLDPMATGVLPVLLGRATKLSDYMLASDKSYTAKIKLGIKTDTLDITGKVLCESRVAVTDEQIDNVLSELEGEISQVPPMFSAIKKDGVRLYSLARQGKTAEIKPRKITVFSLKRENNIDENNEFFISCKVSKGTYIRALARDIGERLGTSAVLTELKRTSTAGFDIKECVELDKLTKENINEYILPASRAVQSFSTVSVTKAQAFRFSNGGSLDIGRLPHSNYKKGEIVKIFSDGEFLGLAKADNELSALRFMCIINPIGKV